MSGTFVAEGLMPWVESGDLNAIFREIARWDEQADSRYQIEISVRTWDLPAGDDKAYPPTLKVAMRCGIGREGKYRGWGTVKIWRGAAPDAVFAALDACAGKCLEGARAQQRAGSTLLSVHNDEIALMPASAMSPHTSGTTEANR